MKGRSWIAVVAGGIRDRVGGGGDDRQTEEALAGAIMHRPPWGEPSSREKELEQVELKTRRRVRASFYLEQQLEPHAKEPHGHRSDARRALVVEATHDVFGAAAAPIVAGVCIRSGTAASRPEVLAALRRLSVVGHISSGTATRATRTTIGVLLPHALSGVLNEAAYVALLHSLSVIWPKKREQAQDVGGLILLLGSVTLSAPIIGPFAIGH